MNTKSREFWIIVFLGLFAVFGLIGWGITPILQQLFR